MNASFLRFIPNTLLRRGLKCSACSQLPRGRENRDDPRHKRRALEESSDVQDGYLNQETFVPSKDQVSSRAVAKQLAPKKLPSMLEEMQNLRGVDNILNFVIPHLRTLDDRELNMTMRRLSTSQLEQRLPPSAFKNDPRFIALLDGIRTKAVFFIDVDQLISAMQVFSLCHVPLSSRVAQVVLSCIKEKINDIEMNKALYLHRMLKKSSDTTKLSRTISQALQMLITDQLTTYGDRIDNPNLLIEILTFLQDESKLTMESQNVVMKNLLGKVSMLDPKKVARLAFSLCNLSPRLQDKPSKPGHYSPSVDPLLEVLYHETVKTISQNLRDYEPEVLINLAFAMANNLKGNDAIYNEDFCKRVSSRALKESWKTRDFFRLCKAFSIMQHVDPSLCKRLSTILRQDLSFFVTNRDPFLHSLSYLSDCNYRPEDFDEILKQLVKKGEHLLNSSSNIELLHFSVDTAILGRLVPSVLKRVFSTQSFEDIEKSGKSVLKYFLLLMDQTVTNFAPELKLPRMPPHILNQWIEDHGTRHLEGRKEGASMLKLALEQAFGGSENVINGAMSQEGHPIDYVVVLRDSDMSPVSINQERDDSDQSYREHIAFTRLEDILVPSGCTRYHIVVNQQMRFVRNVRRLSGATILRLNIISKLPGVLVSISKPDWTELPEH